MKWLDDIPYVMLIGAAILMALLPFQPEPHLIEKLRMLSQGLLTKPIDVFDLFWHSIPMILLLTKFIRANKNKG